MAKQPISLQDVSDQDMIRSLYFSQGLIILISIIVAFIFVRDIEEITSLFFFTKTTFYYGVGFGLIVVLIDLIMMRYLPDTLYDDGGINERVFQALSTPHIFVAMFVVAFSEELLFRGILQSLFGIVVSSLCFALIHIRYLKKPLLLTSVIILSFLLGILFQYTQNLMTTIICHYVIDLCLGLILKREIKLRKRSVDHE